jgi:hypothetical protein
LAKEILHVTSEVKVSFGHDEPHLDMALHTITYMRIIFDAGKCALGNICTG